MDSTTTLSPERPVEAGLTHLEGRKPQAQLPENQVFSQAQSTLEDGFLGRNYRLSSSEMEWLLSGYKNLPNIRQTIRLLTQNTM